MTKVNPGPSATPAGSAAYGRGAVLFRGDGRRIAGAIQGMSASMQSILIRNAVPLNAYEFESRLSSKSLLMR